jgi:hypothetical protein
MDSETGRLIVYTSKPWIGKTTVEVWINGNFRNKVAANIVPRTINGEQRYAAVFPSLPSGNHTLNRDGSHTNFTVFPGELAEINLAW